MVMSYEEAAKMYGSVNEDTDPGKLKEEPMSYEDASRVYSSKDSTKEKVVVSDKQELIDSILSKYDNQIPAEKDSEQNEFHDTKLGKIANVLTDYAVPIGAGVGAAILTGGASIPIQLLASAGAALATSALSTSLDPILEGKTRTKEQAIKQGIKDTAWDVGANVALLGAGRIAKPILNSKAAKSIIDPITTRINDLIIDPLVSLAKESAPYKTASNLLNKVKGSVEYLAKPEIEFEKSAKALSDLRLQSSQIENEVTRRQTAEKWLKNNKIKKIENNFLNGEIAVKEDSAKVLKLRDEIDNDILNSSKQFAEASNTILDDTKKEIDKMYDSIKTGKQATKVVEMDSAKVLDSIDDIKKIDEKVGTKLADMYSGNKKVSELVELRRNNENYIESLYNSGDAVSARLSGLMKNITNDLDDKLGKATGGYTDKLRKIYANYSDAKKSISRFGLSVGETSDIQKGIIESNINESLSSVIDGFIKGKYTNTDLIGNTSKEINRLNNLINISALTGNPVGVRRSKDLLNKFNGIIKKSSDYKSINEELKIGEKLLKELGENNKALSKQIREDISPELQRLLNNEKAIKEAITLAEATKSGKSIDNTTIMSVWIMSEAIGNTPYVPDPLKKLVRLGAFAITAKKWAPKAAKSIISLASEENSIFRRGYKSILAKKGRDLSQEEIRTKMLLADFFNILRSGMEE